MASLDSQVPQQEGRQYPKEDAELAIRLGIKMLKDGGGLKVIAEGINSSKDPAQVIGSFLTQMMGQLAEKLHAEANVDPGVFLAQGGFLDAILNYIEDQLGYPEEFSDQIYAAVLETVKAAAAAPVQPNEANQGAPVVAPPQPPDPLNPAGGP